MRRLGFAFALLGIIIACVACVALLLSFGALATLTERFILAAALVAGVVMYRAGCWGMGLTNKAPKDPEASC